MTGGFLAALGLAAVMVGPMEIWLPMATVALAWSVAVETHPSR